MAVTVLNYFEADRRTVVADEAMEVGDLVKIEIGADTDGSRHITLLGNADDALAVAGNVGVVFKVAGTEDSVQESSASAVTGDRTVSISAGDLVVILRRGAIIEYNADEVDASLDPDNAGALPSVGADLGILGSKWSTIAAAAAGIASPVVGRCFMVNGTKIAVEIVL